MPLISLLLRLSYFFLTSSISSVKGTDKAVVTTSASKYYGGQHSPPTAIRFISLLDLSVCPPLSVFSHSAHVSSHVANMHIRLIYRLLFPHRCVCLCERQRERGRVNAMSAL